MSEEYKKIEGTPIIDVTGDEEYEPIKTPNGKGKYMATPVVIVGGNEGAKNFRGWYPTPIQELPKPNQFNPPAKWGDYIMALGKAGEPELFVVEEVRDVWIYPQIVADYSATLSEIEDSLEVLHNSQKPSGGAITAHDFGKETPTLKELTDYAVTDIWGTPVLAEWDDDNPRESTYTFENGITHKAGEIFNNTWVRNTYNGLNHRWVLTNTPDTYPVVFIWTNAGVDTVSQATDIYMGILKLYNGNGNNEDGSITQKGITELLALHPTNEQYDTYREVAANGTGFPPDSARLVFDADSGDVTLFSNSDNLVSYYNGKKIVGDSSMSISLDGYYNGYVVLINDNGEDKLVLVQVPTHLNHRIVAWVGYNPNSPLKFWYQGYELHTPYRNPEAHFLWHLSLGMAWFNGGELTKQNPNDLNDTKFNLSDVFVADEDLRFTIFNTALQGVKFGQSLRHDNETGTTELLAPSLYVDVNGELASTTADMEMSPIINPLTSENKGSFIPIEDGKYANRWLCLTTCQAYPIKWLIGRQQFDKLSDTRLEQFKSLGLPTPEIIAAYQVIIQADSDSPSGLKILDITKVGRASKIDEFALTSAAQLKPSDMYEYLETKQAYWTEQIHENETGKWLALNGANVDDYLSQGYAWLLSNSPKSFQSGGLVYAPMTSATAPAPQVITYSSQVSGTYAAWRAFATSNTYAWRTSNYTSNPTGSIGDQWVQLDLGAGNKKSALKLSVQIDKIVNAPQRIRFSGRDDLGGMEVLLLEVDNLIWTYEEEIKTFTLDHHEEEFRYFTFRCEAIQGTTTTYLALLNIFINGIGASVVDTIDAVSGAVTYVKVP